MSRKALVLMMILVMALALALVAGVACNPQTSASTESTQNPSAAQTAQPAPLAESPLEPEGAPMPEKGLPKLVDFGAETCIPCREMMPILGKLASDFKGKLVVEVVNVHEEMDRARAAGVRLIPTQVFYSPDGQELSRHEGFMSREDILKEWARLGYEFGEPESGA